VKKLRDANGGTQIGERNLGDEVVVREASAEEMADRPAKTPELAESKDTQKYLKFTGFYVVPGSGLAAIFGARRSG
jgi:hypothetical protein